MKGYSMFFLCLLILSCNDRDDDKPVTSKGNRKLGFHITTTEVNDYVADFEIAKSAGMETIPITFLWTSIETSSGWDFTFPDIANTYYPAQGVEVVLTVSPIYAIGKDVPADIASLAFSEPVFISRFNKLLDSLHYHMPQVTLTALVIGNEVDIYLNDNVGLWQQYKVFFEAVREHAKALWGANLRVGVECTLDRTKGAMASSILSLTEHSDVAVVSYYPLNNDFTMKDPAIVQSEFTALTNFYNKPIIIEETGYATSDVCNSSELKQKQYITEIFNAWDTHHEQILFIGFLWLSDLSDAATQKFVDDYGGSSNPNKEAFAAYLQTTGLRTYPGSGQDKIGFIQLKSEVIARGW